MARTSRYTAVQLQTTGPSYNSRVIPLSSQRSINLYPEATPTGMSESVMHSWPGIEILTSSLAATLDYFRGSYYWKGLVYAVYGSNLVSMDSSYNTVTIGAVSVSADARAVFTDNGDTMLCCVGSTPFSYDGTTITPLTGVTFNPTFCDFLNERFLLNGDDQAISVSDVLSTNFDSANVFYARSSPDTTVSQYIFNQVVYVFGENSIEPWQDVGTGAPPLSRMNGGIIEDIGVLSPYAIANTDRYMYFVATDGHAYRVSSFSAEEITNPVIASHFKGLNLAKVVANRVNVNGHKFIIFTFRDDDETWVYSENSESWFELADTEYSPWFVDSFIEAFDNVVGFDTRGGLIWKLTPDQYYNSGKGMLKQRVLSVLSGDDFGKPQHLMEMSKLVLSVETGVATDLASTPNPKISVTPSFDGGHTWSREYILELGTRGDYTLPVELHLMKQFRRAVFKITSTDFISSFTIFSACIYLREAGH
jgi:hypothetical protein